MRKKRSTPLSLLTETILVVLSIVFVIPILLVIINSLKPYEELMKSFISLPSAPTLDNYIHAWNLMEYPKSFLNTLFITVFSVAGIVLFGSMAAYKLQRTRIKISGILFIFFIAQIMIPFQTIMITLTKLTQILHLSSSHLGLIVLYWGFGMPMAVFLYHGFMKTIPREIDECAYVDGCNSFKAFFHIIFPLLKPVTGTIIVLDVMWIWNDFLLPLLMINNNKSQRTLQLAAYTFFGQYISDWQYAMASVALTVLPSIIFFLLMQKYIVKGVIAGAVKG